MVERKKTIFKDTFSEEVWRSTYKHHTDETVDDTMLRVATAIAGAEETEELREYWIEQFYDMLTDFKCTAGGRIYANAGSNFGNVTLMNCYTAPRAKYDIDSLENIMVDLKNQTQTLRSEGGWGQSFNYIRPRSSFIYGIGVESPGSVRFMEIFNTSSDIITSGSGMKSKNKKAKGKIRKGAMMSILSVWHPDILEFITAKQQPGKLTKFNMSVDCSDEFMNRVLKIAGGDSDIELDKWNLIFPNTQHPNYKSEWDGDIKEWQEKGYPVIIHNTISVMYLFNLIMESTYNRAEPGILYLDRANYFAPANYVEKSISCNPCAEQIMPAGSVCDLGSLNLTQMVNDNKTDFDYSKIKKYVKCLVRFLDNVNDISKAPLPEYENSMKSKRRIGLGIMGWGSALYMLKCRIASPEANIIRDRLMKFIAQEAYKASIDLAVEKGMFTACNPIKHADGVFVNNLDLPIEYMEKLKISGIRNSSILSIQPTGNTGILANISSGGLEPVFMHSYIRTVIVNDLPEKMTSFTPKWFEGAWYETNVFKFAFEGDEQILKGEFEGTVYKIDKSRGLTKEVLCEDFGVSAMKAIGEWDETADWASTAEKMSPDDHLNDLAGFAKWVDSSISKTVNMPNNFPLDKFKDIYLDAYRSGVIKGVTTYRSGCFTSVLSAVEEKTATPDEEEVILDSIKLPTSSPATVVTLKNGGVKYYLTVTWNGDKPFALFVYSNNREKTVTTDDAVERLMAMARNKGLPEHHIKSTIDKMAKDNNSSRIARTISLCLRHGIFVKSIVKTLGEVESACVGSFIFSITKFLSSLIKDGEKAGEVCTECGSDKVVYKEGCKICQNCGNSRCG
jgi:ribonucleoside-diphosphate reductase alpha chain